MYLPVVFAALVLTLPYLLRNVLVAPILIRVAETAVSLELERRVELSAHRVSGSWFGGIALEEVRFFYGVGPFPMQSAEAALLRVVYDPTRLLEGDLLSIFSLVEGRGLLVRLNRRATVSEIKEEIREEPDFDTDTLVGFLDRTLRTPVLDLEGTVVTPRAEEGDHITFFLAGRHLLTRAGAASADRWADLRAAMVTCNGSANSPSRYARTASASKSSSSSRL
jgi:hypothetical protein